MAHQESAEPEGYVIGCLIRGDWERALELIRELGPAPQYAPLLAGTAERLLAARQPAPALRTAEEAVSLDDACAAARHVYGRALLAAGDAARAAAALHEAVELAPDRTAARIDLAAHYLEQGQLEAARVGLEAVLNAAPDDPAALELLKSLRKAFERQGDRGAAEALRRLAGQLHQRRATGSDRLPTVSLCLIVRNEAQNLPRVVRSVRGLATEVVVVDTGSTDDTVRIARRLGAKVSSFSWCDDFSAARNRSLELAAGEWLLVLDADDEFPQASAEAVRAWLARHPAAEVVGLYRRYPHPDMAQDTVSIQPRLFRGGKGFRFEGAIHERLVDAAGRVLTPDATLDATILHHGAGERRHAEARRERNLRLLLAAVERDPNDLRARFYAGLTCFQGQDWPGAVSHLQAVVQDGTDPAADFLPKAYACLGNALFQASRPLEAEATVQEGLERFAEHPELWFSLGVVLDGLGRLEEAAAAHERALAGRFGPGLNWHDWSCRDAKPHLALADLRLALGDPEAAGRHLDRAERYSGPQPEFAAIRAAIAREAAAREAREQARREAIAGWEARLDAGDAEAGPALVTALLEAGETERAGVLVEEWSERGGAGPELLLGQGLVYSAVGRKEEALSCFERAGELRPELREAWLGAAEALRALDRPEDAEAVLLRVPGAGDDPRIGQTLGELYLAQERWDDAAGAFQPLCERGGAWRAWLGLGRARLRTGDLSSAVACYERAASLSGGAAAVRAALGDARAYLAR